MCGRATLTNDDFEGIAAELDAEFSPEDAALYRPRYNIAPTDLHWIVDYGADRRVLRPAIWGYRASGGRPLINVRGEQVGSGRGFREAFASRRCLVVTDGFFEWDRAKAPFWFHRADRRLVLLAGLFQPPDAAAPPPDGRPRPRFTILTTQPNRLVAEVHDRMPVVVAPPAIDAWLTAEPAAAATLIKSAPEDALIATPVSRRVGSVKNDDPACLLPPDAAQEEAKAPVQGKLF
jgi:putative SOS response-associated peptidase YedK